MIAPSCFGLSRILQGLVVVLSAKLDSLLDNLVDVTRPPFNGNNGVHTLLPILVDSFQVLVHILKAFCVPVLVRIEEKIYSVANELPRW